MTRQLWHSLFLFGLTLALFSATRARADALNALMTAAVLSEASNFDVQIFATPAQPAADQPALISWVAHGADTCNLTVNGAPVQGAEGPLRSAGGITAFFNKTNPTPNYTITCQGQLGGSKSASTTLSWQVFAAGGPEHPSALFSTRTGANSCVQAIASDSDANCAKMVQVGYVTATAGNAGYVDMLPCKCHGGYDTRGVFSWNKKVHSSAGSSSMASVQP